VARAGRQSRHNLKYWQDGEWLGFGCGAHSTRGAARWKNIASTEEYVARIQGGTPVATDRRERGDLERLGDALFTGLRLTEGVDLAEVGARYGIDAWGRYEPALRPSDVRRSSGAADPAGNAGRQRSDDRLRVNLR
jgi:oxygen-independent coproporphyrinogen-3 oxidase